MIDLIKKTLLTGVGLAVMTKEKVEELGKDLVSQAKLSEHEGKEFVDNLLKQSETAREGLRGPDQRGRPEGRLRPEPREQGRGRQALREGGGAHGQATVRGFGNPRVRAITVEPSAFLMALERFTFVLHTARRRSVELRLSEAGMAFACASGL